MLIETLERLVHAGTTVVTGELLDVELAEAAFASAGGVTEPTAGHAVVLVG